MNSHEFSLLLNREVTDAEAEALYEAGCSDAAVETVRRCVCGHLARVDPAASRDQ